MKIFIATPNIPQHPPIQWNHHQDHLVTSSHALSNQVIARSTYYLIITITTLSFWG